MLAWCAQVTGKMAMNGITALHNIESADRVREEVFIHRWEESDGDGETSSLSVCCGRVLATYEMTLVDILTAIVHLQVVGCIFYSSKRVLKLSVKTIFNALLDNVPVLACNPLKGESKKTAKIGFPILATATLHWNETSRNEI